MRKPTKDKTNYVRYVPSDTAPGGGTATPHQRPDDWIKSGHYLIVVDKVDDQLTVRLVLGGVWPIPVPLKDGSYMRIYWLHLRTGNYVGLSKADADEMAERLPIEAQPLDRCIYYLGHGQMHPTQRDRLDEMFPTARMIYHNHEIDYPKPVKHTGGQINMF